MIEPGFKFGIYAVVVLRIKSVIFFGGFGIDLMSVMEWLPYHNSFLLKLRSLICLVLSIWSPCGNSYEVNYSFVIVTHWNRVNIKGTLILSALINGKSSQIKVFEVCLSKKGRKR